MNRTMQRLLGILVLVSTGTSSAWANPFEFFIDQFTVTKLVNTRAGPIPIDLVNDAFDDGLEPPKGPDGVTDVYLILDSPWPAGSETGGKLALTDAGAARTMGPEGKSLLTQRARLGSNITPGSDLGLRSDDVFVVLGLFDLSAPARIGEAYGIKLTDTTSASNLGNDSLDLLVRRSEQDQIMVQLLRSDFAAQTATLIEEYLVDFSLGDQILLTFAKLLGSRPEITAQYQYVDGGAAAGAPVAFANSVEIFNGEDFTRAEFKAVQFAPEPGSLALLTFGLALFASRGRGPKLRIR